MEVLVLLGIAVAIVLTLAVVLLKLFLALLAVPFKLLGAVFGGGLKLVLGLAIAAVVIFVVLPTLCFLTVASGLVLAALF